MGLWLIQHWAAATGGGISLSSLAIWLYRRLRFRHLLVTGDCWAFEYHRPMKQEEAEPWDWALPTRGKKRDE